METLLRYGRGIFAFLGSIGRDVLRWIWEDVKGAAEFVWLGSWALFALALFIVCVGLTLSALSAIF